MTHIFKQLKIYVWLLLSACFCAQSAFTQNVDTSSFIGRKYQYANQVYKEALKNKDSVLLAEAYYLFGKLSYPNHLEEATQWFTKSLRITEKKGLSFETARLYVRMADIEQAQHHDEAYRALLNKAKQIIIRSNSKRGYQQFMKLIEDIEANIESEASKKLKPSDRLSELYHVGRVNLEKHNLPKAGKYLKQALSLARSLPEEVYTVVWCRIKLLEIDVIESRLSGIERELNDIDARITKEMDNNFFAREAFLKLKFNYLKKSGQWEKAIGVQDQLHSHQNILLLADRDARITQLQIDYQVEQKDNELVRQADQLRIKNESLESQRVLLASAVIIIVMLGMSSFFLYRFSQEKKRTSLKNEILLKEQNHRVKNNLQFVSSLLNLQKEKSKDPETVAAIENAQLRIESIAILHRTLYDGQYLGKVHLPVFLKKIMDNVFNSLGCESVRAAIDIPDFYLDPDKAIAAGIILNELFVNSCKHVFKPTKQAEVMIRMSNEGGFYHLQYRDSGEKSPEEYLQKETFKGFGTELIWLQVEQLNGTLKVTDEKIIEIIFPE